MRGDDLVAQVMHVVSGSHFVRRDEDGRVVVDTRASPDFTMPGVLHSAGKPVHTFENTGPDDLIVIGVEHKPLVAAG